MVFKGFPVAALDFYEGLEDDNSKAYWVAHQRVFEESVKAPMQALVAELPPEFGAFKIFRPYRDVRFSNDKSPYKTQYGAVSETERGNGWYFHVSAAGVLVAGGFHAMARDQLARFRSAVADERTGNEFVQLCAAAAKAKVPAGPGLEAPLKTAPKGLPADHPRIEHLRWKGCSAMTEITAPTVIDSPGLLQRIVGTWTAMGPLIGWLENNVGPTAEGRRR